MVVVTGSASDDTGKALVSATVSITMHENVNPLNPPSLLVSLFTGTYNATTDSNGKWRIDTGFLADQILLSSFSGSGSISLPSGDLGAYQGTVANFTCGPPGYTADTGMTVCTYNPFAQPESWIQKTLGTVGTILLTIAIVLGLAYIIYYLVKKFIFKEKPTSVIQIISAIPQYLQGKKE